MMSCGRGKPKEFHGVGRRFEIPSRRGRFVAASSVVTAETDAGPRFDDAAMQRELQQLRESEMRFRQIAESVQEVLWLSDPDKSCMFYASPAFERIWGISREELYADPRAFLHAIHPEDRERISRNLPRQHIGNWSEEFRIRRPDGSVRWIWAQAFPVRDARGNVVRIAGLSQDITERRLREEERDHFFRLALDLFCVADFDGYFKAVNPAWERTIGYTADELLAEPFVNFVHPDDRSATLAELGRIAAGAKTLSFENRYRCKNGSYRWLLWSAISVPERGACYAVARDITERKRVEEALADRSRLSALAADVGVALQRSDARDMLRGCCEALVTHLGAAFARVWTLAQDGDVLELQASAGMYTHLDGQHSMVPLGDAKIGAIARERRPQLDNDLSTDPWIGDPEWAAREGLVSFAGYPLLLGDRVVGVIAMFARHPLSEFVAKGIESVAAIVALGIERKRADEALRVNEERTRHVIDAALDAVVTISDSGIVVDWNTQAERTFGWSRAEIVGRSLAETIVPERHRASFAAGLVRYAETGKGDMLGNRVEMTALHRTGHEFPVEIEIVGVRTGRTLVFSAFVRDLTERRRAQEQERRHQAELAHAWRVSTMGEMATTLAHELNQPLSAIVNYARGSARRMEAGKADVGEILRVVDEMARQAERAAEIIRKIRGFVRKEELPRTDVDPNDVVREVASLAAPEANNHQAALHLDLAVGLPKVNVDVIQIEQVLLNLVRNGLEAMSDVPRDQRAIVIRSGRGPSGDVHVSVRDNGRGITDAQTERIFQPFYTTKPRGLGVGLSISRSIVEAHGGKLWMDPSDAPGASFTFSLPPSAAAVGGRNVT